MKKHYTDKQICEAIHHWTTVLQNQMVNESKRSELAVCKRLQSIICDRVSSSFRRKFDVNQIAPIKEGVPSDRHATTQDCDTPYIIWHAGGSNTSDIYIQRPDGDVVGIEVKETPYSKLFNPQLSWNRNTGRLSFINKYMDSNETSIMGAWLLPDDIKYEITDALERFCRVIDSNGQVKAPDGFPFNAKAAGFDTPYQYMHTALAPKLRASTARIKLASGVMDGNDVVKAYFNSARGHNKTYFPVQYIQYGDALYALRSLYSCDFFKANGTYNVYDYDKEFDGTSVKWYITFPKSQSDRYVRIDGDVRANTKPEDSVSLLGGVSPNIAFNFNAVFDILHKSKAL